MANRQVVNSTEYLHFSGAETKTIAISDDYSALVMYLDMSAPVTHRVDIKIGTVQVWAGFINSTPVQLSFGQGRGSGIYGQDIVVITDGEADIFVGVKQNLIGNGSGDC